MKKKILALLLLTPLGLLSCTIEKIYNDFYVTNPQRCSEITGSNKPLESIVAWKEIEECLKAHDVRRFQELEKLFLQQNLSIFDVKYKGYSLLQHAVLNCPHIDLDLHWEMFDYLLSRVSAAQLNESVLTSVAGTYDNNESNRLTARVEDGCDVESCSFHLPLYYREIVHAKYFYYKTAVALAALVSSTALEKILNHPLFDESSFINQSEVGILERFDSTNSRTSHFVFSLTAARCLSLLYAYQSAQPNKFFVGKSIALLTERFGKYYQG